MNNLTRRLTQWNKDKLIGQRPPLKQREIWSVRVRLQMVHKLRDLALFNLAIDSKLRGCDLTSIKVRDISNGIQISRRALVMQRKTQMPVQFEITEQTCESLQEWIHHAKLTSDSYLFKSRFYTTLHHLSTRQYSRLIKEWVKMINLDPAIYGTHLLRRTKATLIYKRTKNLRAVPAFFKTDDASLVKKFPQSIYFQFFVLRTLTSAQHISKRSLEILDLLPNDEICLLV